MGDREGGREGGREGHTFKLETPALALPVISHGASRNDDEDGGLEGGREGGRERGREGKKDGQKLRGKDNTD